MRRLIGSLSLLALAVSPLFAQVEEEKFWEWVKDQPKPEVFSARREKLRSMLPDGGIAVFFTNPEQARNNDVDFQFRADSNFLYLTGLDEPDAALIVSKDGFNLDGQRVNEVVFVNDRNPGAETWLGYRFGPIRAKEVMGYQVARSNKDFGTVLAAIPLAPTEMPVLASTNLPGRTGFEREKMIGKFDQWVAGAKGSVKVSTRMRSTLDAMRFIKEQVEIDLLKKACSISAKSHNEVMKACHPGATEYQMSALMEYGFKFAGCEYLGYGNIVGSGANSCILHYMKNTKPLKGGDLLLMDCGGEYRGYTADVTRTIPVNGKFTPEQKAIYEIVLEAQTAGINACTSGKSFGEPHRAATDVIAKGLTKLGIIQNDREVGRYFMHGTSHTLGLDVHDTMAPDSTLRPGVVLTVEPGIYIKAGSPCDKKWWNIGVRIEDDILVTGSSPINLSVEAPRSVADIEKMMAQGAAARKKN